MTTQTITYTTTTSWLIPLTQTQTTVRTAIPADTIIDRYYYVADVQCSASYPPGPPEINSGGGGGRYEPPPPWNPPPTVPIGGGPYCEIIEEVETEPASSWVVINADRFYGYDYIVTLETRLLCPG